MKKYGIILAIALLLSLFSPCVASDAQSCADGTYIVKLDASGSEQAEKLGLTEVYADEGLYLADVSDVSRLSGDIEYCEKDTKAYLVGSTEELGAQAELMALTNDRYSGKQWSLTNVQISGSWSAGYYGDGVKIAVIDSGVRTTHEDLRSANIAAGYNVLDGTTDVTDDTGHGTFVSGVLAASMNNGKGIAGLCQNVTIIPIKCFGSGETTDASYIVTAIYKAVDTYDCDVLNLSLGLNVNLQSMKQALEYATSKGVIVVAAVGNDGTSELSYPAAYPNVVGVGSVDSSGNISSFSQRNTSVYIVAPGSDIVSTGFSSDTSYVMGRGTSFSTPHAAAAAAVLKEYQPQADTDDFMEILKESSTDLGTTGYDTTFGYGSLNFTAMVSAMRSYDFSGSSSPEIGDPSNGETTPVPTPSDGGNDDTTVTDPLAKYTDLTNHWARTEISYCVGRKYFVGISSSMFGPEYTMTRGMFITVLARMSGENISGYYNTFNDITEDKYYCEPCSWAATKKIIDADADGNFNPEANITREQMATFLYRYAGTKGYISGSQDLNVISGYSDYSYLSSWAVDPMAWAVKNGIINGRTTTTLCPKDTAKRSEVSAIVYRFAEQYEK